MVNWEWLVVAAWFGGLVGFSIGGLAATFETMRR